MLIFSTPGMEEKEHLVVAAAETINSIQCFRLILFQNIMKKVPFLDVPFRHRGLEKQGWPKNECI